MVAEGPERVLDAAASYLAEALPRVARGAKEEKFKIECEKLLGPVLVSLGVSLDPSYEKRTVLNGLSDALYGRLIIEYETPGTLARPGGLKHAVEQLEGYMTGEAAVYGERAPEVMSKFLGVALDGVSIAFVEYLRDPVSPSAAPESLPGSQLALFPLTYGLAGNFRSSIAYPVSTESIRLFLVYLRSLSRHSLTAENLAQHFGPGSGVAEAVVNAFAASIRTHSTPLVETLFASWRQVFGVIYGEALTKPSQHLGDLKSLYGIRGGGDLHELLFAVHSYYALLTKIIAAELASLQPGSFTASPAQQMAVASSGELFDLLRDLEDGSLFRQLGIANFLEGDYFGWYLKAWNADLAKSLSSIASQLAQFEPATSELRSDETRDLLKRLYQYLMPDSLRHDLGEYYTPDWLVEFLLDSAGIDGAPERTYLDPACGSGSFLVSLIRRMKEQGVRRKLDPKVVAHSVVANLAGFDINPLAVITARTNFLFALGPELRRYLPHFSVPIYLCDSLMKPAQTNDEGSRGWLLRHSVGDFVVPQELVDRSTWESLAELLEDAVTRDLDAAWVIGRLESGANLGGASVQFIETTLGRLKELHSEDKDRVWARILKNNLAPLFVGPRDYVVGNPPWIRWQYLSREYRNQTIDLWRRYGLFSLKGYGARLGGGEKDLSALFVYACADAYLRDQGVLAFVITQTVFRAKGAAEGFRRFRLGETGASLKVMGVDDLSSVQPFEDAGNLTTVLVLRKGEPTTYPVPYRVWAKKGAARLDPTASVQSAMDRLTSQVSYATPVDGGVGPWRIGEAGVGSGVPVGAYSARLGVRADPYGVFLVRIARDLGDGLVLIENLPKLGKTKLRTVQAAIEKQTLYPTVAGRHVERWHVRDSGIYLVFVQDPARQRGLAEDFLKRERGRTFDYLAGFRTELLAVGSAVVRELREEGPFYSMYSVTEETLAPYKVAWPRMTNHMQACVISSVFDDSLGKRPLLPTETVAFIPLLVEREAHYLCALLNSTPVGRDLSSFSAAGRGFASPSVLRHLPLPRYEATALQERLADLSIEAHARPASFGANRQQELDALVADCFAAYGVAEAAAAINGAEHAP
jgi:N-6 DNA Methylase